MSLCSAHTGSILLLALWAVYLLWLSLPAGSPLLAFLPSQYVALVPPCLLLWVVCTYGVTYGALALAVTPPLDSIGTLWDEFSARPCMGPDALLEQARAGTQQQQQPLKPLIPAMGDLPITLVNKAQLLAYQEGMGR